MSGKGGGAAGKGSARVHVSYAIVFVSDMEHSVAFYRYTIGLPQRFQSPGWTEFESGEATLARDWRSMSIPTAW